MDPPKEIARAFYEQRLKIDENNMDKEVAEYAELLFKVSEEAAFSKSRAVKAEDALEVTEARLYKTIALAKEAAKERVTEASIKNDVLLHPERLKALEDLRSAELESAQWESLRKSHSSRADMVKETSQRQLSGFFATSTVYATGTSRQEVKAERNREALAEAAKKRTWRERL